MASGSTPDETEAPSTEGKPPAPRRRKRRRKKVAPPLPSPVLGPVTVKVDNVHIKYRIRGSGGSTLRARIAGAAAPDEIVHAVKGVSFTIRSGEAVGIVGSNGSGKSSLLRALTGLAPIDEGEILVRSQPRLLGVSAAMRRDLTGAQNIFVGGLALGMTSAEIEERFDEIVEFTGLGSAINRPIGGYSSGMAARLKFAIATAVKSEVLLLDEALAVGDRRFRNKSLRRVRELIADAGTVIMVTHGLGEITRTCHRVIWLEQGELIADGPTADVLAEYTSGPDE